MGAQLEEVHVHMLPPVPWQVFHDMPGLADFKVKSIQSGPGTSTLLLYSSRCPLVCMPSTHVHTHTHTHTHTEYEVWPNPASSKTLTQPLAGQEKRKKKGLSCQGTMRLWHKDHAEHSPVLLGRSPPPPTAWLCNKVTDL